MIEKNDKLKTKKVDYKKMVEIKPLRDHTLHCPPHFSKKLEKGIPIEVPEFLKSSLKTEGVI